MWLDPCRLVGMSMVNDRVRAQLAAALVPGPADLAIAHEVIVELLSTGARLRCAEIVRRVYEEAGLQGVDGAEIDVFRAQRDPDQELDADQPALRQHRLLGAIHEELADLEAAGTIVPMNPPDGGGNDVVLNLSDVAPGGGGTRGGEQLPLARPRIAEAYRLGRRLLDDPAWRAVRLSLTSVDLAPLLGGRGERCFNEALEAHRRGLYLAAVNMAGAASEAAWFTLGEAMQDDIGIARALGEDATGRLIKRVVEKLRGAPRMATTADELFAHASYLRDLRNYGLHPRSSSEPAREGAFTESGCLILIMETHRYLVRLLDAARAYGVELSSAESPSSSATPR